MSALLPTSSRFFGLLLKVWILAWLRASTCFGLAVCQSALT